MVQCKYIYKNGAKRKTECGRVLRGAAVGETFCYEHKKSEAIRSDNKEPVIVDVDDIPISKPERKARKTIPIKSDPIPIPKPVAPVVVKEPIKVNKKKKIEEIIKVSESSDDDDESGPIKEDLLLDTKTKLSKVRFLKCDSSDSSSTNSSDTSTDSSSDSSSDSSDSSDSSSE